MDGDRERLRYPDTGVPGEIGGYASERLIRAQADGIMEPCAMIGDVVEKGQKVAETGRAAVYAEMTGIVRGMLQPGVKVTKGLKIGDIDARQCREYCESISDKARSIGGGVLEAVTRYERQKYEWGSRYAIIFLVPEAVSGMAPTSCLRRREACPCISIC